MKTVLDIKGQLTIPKKLRDLRKLRAGERFDVALDEDDPDLILVRRQRRSANAGLLDHLLACPVKGCLEQPPRRVEPTRRVEL